MGSEAGDYFSGTSRTIAEVTISVHGRGHLSPRSAPMYLTSSNSRAGWTISSPNSGRAMILLFVLLSVRAASVLAGQLSAPETRTQEPPSFLYGASVYPELMEKEEWTRMLDEFQAAHFNVVRIADSTWGNLEIAPGRFKFGWLREALDDLARRNIRVIMGTSTYVPPQWLTARHPETLVQLFPGTKVHPMSRKAACLNHPLYREACRRFVRALAETFKDHPAIIGWQLDNEMDIMVPRICYNPACDRAWTQWLLKTYSTPEEFNRRLHLQSWAQKVDSLEEVPQPTETAENILETPQRAWAVGAMRHLPALSLASRHFRRDVVLDFLREQRDILRSAGVRQWITHDSNDFWLTFHDDPQAGSILDVGSMNFYQPAVENPGYWTSLAWRQDMNRSAFGRSHFLVTESRIGVYSSTVMDDVFPSHDQFRMWMLQPAAFGASSLLYWSSLRWRGGHWPQFGALMDWTGKPEPDLAWVGEVGEWYGQWGRHLAENPVQARAAILTDYDQRAALQIYSHVPSSLTLLPEAFDAFHRWGIGVDSINSRKAEDSSNLNQYSLLVLAAATTLDSELLPTSLERFVERGGQVLITPFTAYQSWDGVFRGDGLGSNLFDLSGSLVRSGRRMGTAAEGRQDQQVAWNGIGLQGLSPVGMDGYCELLETSVGAEVIARYRSEDEALQGKPAATLKRLGRGRVVRMAFWPADDSFLRLIRMMVTDASSLLAAPVPAGVLAVPRSDGSLFVVNTSGRPGELRLARRVRDRLSARKLPAQVRLSPYQVLWLESLPDSR
ncbi:MAG: beta-galactosidase [Acidobacteriota bacterium]